MQPAVLDVERPAAGVAALADQDALGSAVRDLRVGGDAVRPVEHARADPERQRLRVGPEDVLGPRLGNLRALRHQPLDRAAIDREDVVLPGFGIPHRDQLDELVPVLRGQIVVLGWILGDVVQLPVASVQTDQRLRGNERAERLAGLGERRPRPRAHRPPSVVVDGAVTEHLEILDTVPGRGGRVVEGMGEADPVQRRLGHAPDRGGRLEAERVQDRRDHVDDVRILGAYLAARADPPRPVHQERVGGAAAVGLPLPPAERRVARPGPPPRVVVEGGWAAEFIDLGEAVLQRFGRVVEELQLVGGARRAALGAGPVVRNDHDQRVVELPDLLQEVEQTADVMVGVGQETGVHLHHPRRQPALVRRQRAPLRDVRVVPGQLRAGRHHA